MDSILEWILAVIGSGGIGAAITYICTFNSKRREATASAEVAETKADHEKLDLAQDKYEFLQKTFDKYMKDYHELESDFRRQIKDLREQMDKIMFENSQAISAKCNEIATLKSQVTYLKGLRCYNFTCTHRLKANPDKSE